MRFYNKFFNIFVWIFLATYVFLSIFSNNKVLADGIDDKQLQKHVQANQNTKEVKNINWQQVFGANDSRRIRAITEDGKGGFFAVGELGVYATTNNIKDWKRGTIEGNLYLLDIIRNKNTYVAVGRGSDINNYGTGYIYTFVEGQEWVQTKSIINSSISAVAYGNGKYVAIGNNGIICISDDGKDWTQVETGFKDDLNNISFIGECFYAIGDSGTILKSKDGEHWNVIKTSAKSNLFSIFANPNIICISGSSEFIYSKDGVNWIVSKDRKYPFYMFDGIWNGEMFMAVGEFGRITVSYDGENWTNKSQPFDVGSFSKISLNGKNFILLSEYGDIIYTEGNGISFNKYVNSKTYDFNCIQYNGKLFIAGDNSGNIFNSTDGANWKQSKYADSRRMGSISNIIWNGEIWVAFGGGIACSKDGLTWSSLNGYQLEDPLGNIQTHSFAVGGMIWNGGQFVAVGSQGKLFKSEDGISWNVETAFQNNEMTDIIFSNDVYTAIGFNGVIYTSKDLLRWELVRSSQYQCLMSIASNGTEYVVVGSGGLILTSQSGGKWDCDSYSYVTRHTINKVIWDGNQFVAVNMDGEYFVSHDGKAWALGLVDSFTQINSICYTGNAYYAVGKFKIYKGEATGKNVKPIKRNVIFQVDNRMMHVNDLERSIDYNGTTPIIKEGRTLIPIRPLTESLGAILEWDQPEQKITVHLDGNKVEIWIDRNIAMVNGESVSLDVPAQIYNGRTLIPLRFVTEALGCEVDWNKDTKTIIINYNRY